MAKSNKTQFAILGMLSFGPMSGYEIRQTMQQSTAHFWAESDGQIYPTLTQLTAAGFIECQADKSSTREKKIYSITTQGSNELKAWLEQEPETQIVRSEFMLKLFFGANASPAISIEHIQSHRYKTKNQLAELTAIQEQLKKDYKASPHLVYWQISLQYGMQLAEAKIKWCDDAIRQLTEIERGNHV